MLFTDSSNAYTDGLVSQPMSDGMVADDSTLLSPLPEVGGHASNALPTFRVEAEDMLLTNYRVEHIEFASNQMVASFWGEEKGESGSVSTLFEGPSGTYDIVLGYFDEEGGGAKLNPLLNGQSLGAIKLDQKLGSNLATAETLVRRTVSRRTLQAGDLFEVFGAEDANEHARIDYIDFVQIAAAVDPADVDNTLPAPIRINAGGGEYIDSLGQVWQADQFFDDGKTAFKNVAIEGTEDDYLYRSERYAKTLDYSVEVANGTYDLNLLFAEIYWSGDGHRTFDIEVEGESITQDLDIHAQAGKFNTFNQQVKEILVTDGRLDISMTGIQDKAKLAGFEIFTLPSEGDDDPTTPTDPVAEGPQPRHADATVRYITPHGTGDGSSWEQAASIVKLDNLVEAADPGDEVWIAGDLGEYDVAGKRVTFSEGGSAELPIYIRGVASGLAVGADGLASDGLDSNDLEADGLGGSGHDVPLFVGDRAEDWSPGKSNGGELFRLLDGADHLHFSNLNFKNIGNGAFQLGGDLQDITLEDMTAHNVRRFVENNAIGDAESATVSDLTIRNVDVFGFSKSAIRLKYNTHNVLIEDVLGDSQHQDGDRFAMGVHLQGTVNNVVHRRVTMNNAIQTKDHSQYWNADGFVTNWGTYDITYEDTYAAGSTDGGYDLKSQNTLLIRAGAADNKRNFRIWRDATMIDVYSDDPLRRGGTGTDAHIHVLGEGHVTLEGGTFTGNQSIENIIFDLDDQGRIVVRHAVITDDLYTLYTGNSDHLQLHNLLEP